MLFNTPTQFAVLLLVLIVGWLFGLASHPGGKKWKKAYRDEEAARAKDVADRDARIRELEATNTTLTTERDGLISERDTLVTERDDLRAAGTTTAAAAAATTAAAARADEPAGKRGWFGSGRADDLTRLRGVDAELAALFKREGVTGLDQVANLSDPDESALERRLDLPAGYIRREQLREQARLLVDDRADEHARRFG